MDSDLETNEIQQKFYDLKKYVPYLVKLIENLRNENANEEKLNQMQLLYNLLMNPSKRYV